MEGPVLVPRPAPQQLSLRARGVRSSSRQRGVELRILHASLPSRAFRDEFDRHRRLVQGGLELRMCPRVHLKTVIIDAELVYLGSANWTGAGLGAKGEGRRNFELGMVSDDEQLIDQVQALYDTIWNGDPCSGLQAARGMRGAAVRCRAAPPRRVARGRHGLCCWLAAWHASVRRRGQAARRATRPGVQRQRARAAQSGGCARARRARARVAVGRGVLQPADLRAARDVLSGSCRRSRPSASAARLRRRRRVIELRWRSEFEPLWSEARRARRARRIGSPLPRLDRSGSLRDKYFAVRENRTCVARWYRHTAARARAQCSCTATWAATSRSRSACSPCASCSPAGSTSCSRCCRSMVRAATCGAACAGRRFLERSALHDRGLSPARARSSRAVLVPAARGRGHARRDRHEPRGYSSALLPRSSRACVAVLFIALGSIGDFIHGHGGLPGAPEQQTSCTACCSARSAWSARPSGRARAARTRRGDRGRARSRDRPAPFAVARTALRGAGHTFPGGHILQLGRAQGFAPAFEMLAQAGLVRAARGVGRWPSAPALVHRHRARRCGARGDRARAAGERGCARRGRALLCRPTTGTSRLQFLGAVPEDDAIAVRAACRATAAEPRRSTSSSALPARSSRRVRRASCGSGSRAAREQVDCAVRNLDRPHRAARLSARSAAVRRAPDVRRLKTPADVTALAAQACHAARMPCRTVALFRSHLSPKGARYEALEHYAFAR